MGVKVVHVTALQSCDFATAQRAPSSQEEHRTVLRRGRRHRVVHFRDGCDGAHGRVVFATPLNRLREYRKVTPTLLKALKELVQVGTSGCVVVHCAHDRSHD